MVTTKVKLPAKEKSRKDRMHHSRVLALKAALEAALAAPEQTLEPAAVAARYQLIEQVQFVWRLVGQPHWNLFICHLETAIICMALSIIGIVVSFMKAHRVTR
jgi:hypothetical protein